MGSGVVGHFRWRNEQGGANTRDNDRSTGLSWDEALRLAYAIMTAVDEHLDQKIKEPSKGN